MPVELELPVASEQIIDDLDDCISDFTPDDYMKVYNDYQQDIVEFGLGSDEIAFKNESDTSIRIYARVEENFHGFTTHATKKMSASEQFISVLPNSFVKITASQVYVFVALAERADGFFQTNANDILHPKSAARITQNNVDHPLWKIEITSD
jgi:hypothetical protein